MLEKKQIERISKALGDAYRLKIIEAIRKQEKGEWLQCSAIIDMISLAQSTVSHHLKQLVDADLLIDEKEGRNAKYRLNKDVFNAYCDYFKRYGE
jgi:ArsR family transcriptional regulator